jgi:glycosyltransferase involved in cell wall biosynthesis
MKVSVAMITYNHERFIAQAIESVLMQETSFDFELVIGEDCSTDRTREIVVQFQKRFPDKIRLLLPESNIGLHKNLAQTLATCSGEYVALLEGDDYWTSPQKLQKQAEFLDSEPECSISFHPVRWFYDEAQSGGNGWPEHNSVWPTHYCKYSTIEELLSDIFIQTASVMFRNGLINEYPEWFHKLKMADWPLYVLLAAQGKIGCLNEVMSAYRNHSGGIWFSIEDETRYQEVIKMYEGLNAHFNKKYAWVIRPILSDYYLKLAVFYDQNGLPDRARTCVAKSLAAQIMSKRKPALNSLKMLARLSLPSMYSLSKKLKKA